MSNLYIKNPPAIIFLFGLAGSGKSYIGDLIAKQTGWFVYHADIDITEAMQQTLQEQRPFTDAMRDEFFDLLIGKIQTLAQQHTHLIVTQAAYKQKHRNLLKQNFPDMDMIWVRAGDDVIGQRLRSSNHDGIAPASAAALRQDFEIPDKDYKVIINESDDESVVRQLNRLYGGQLTSPI